MINLVRHSLMLKMLLSAVLIGLVVWAITDSIQNYSLKHIFNSKLEERFSWQAEKQRIMFDRYVKSHHQAVKLFIGSQKLNEFINSPAWQQSAENKTYTKPPPWLPSLSVIRSILQPRYIALLDEKGQCRELYNASDKPAPDALKHPNKMLLNLSHGQGFLTRLNGKAYLLASEKLVNKKGDILATLILASPLDEEFLIASQASAMADSNVIALLAEDQPTILASSNSSLIAPGTKIDTLKDRYLKIGQGFFDYGATDIIIELVSFISTAEASQLTRSVLSEERPIRGLTAIIYILSFIILIFFITRRLQKFTKYVVEFSEQMNLKKTDLTNTGDEISILEENFNRLAEAVQNKTQTLTHQALHDPLTDLPNRKLFHNRLQHEILRGERTSKKTILIMSDLNHFKEINDTLGHHIGDLILQQTAERLFNIFRKTDTVARLGGDEFSILLPETNLEQATILTNKVLEGFNHPFIVDGHTLNVDISIGLAEFPTDGNDVNILMQRADIAMYVAKQNKTGYSIYDKTKDTHSIGRLALMSELKEAISSESLELFFLPKVNVATKQVVTAEALLRWNHPQRGFIKPDEFIPLAEQTGLIKPLTKWVVEKSIIQCSLWKKKNINIAIAVNMSVHCLHDSILLQFILDILKEHDLSPDNLNLEISEDDVMSEPLRARHTLEKIKSTGIHLSIDDFGTGYSSLSYLKKLPIDEIKVDRSFVMEMTEDEDDDVIVLATIELAHNLGLKIVAEGVYDEKTWQRLKSLKCDFAQGHYISKPLNADDFTNWFMSKKWQDKI
ncbi:MAG: EAL domain-containing protein [Gammaproteobacteria bacterium]|nr:EAL domain-containing protein [Gammaproteobacteria bacterium]